MRSWADNVKKNLTETEWEGVDCLFSARDIESWQGLC